MGALFGRPASQAWADAELIESAKVGRRKNVLAKLADVEPLFEVGDFLPESVPIRIVSTNMPESGYPVGVTLGWFLMTAESAVCQPVLICASLNTISDRTYRVAGSADTVKVSAATSQTEHEL